MFFWALEEIKTVQLGMKLLEGHEVAAANLGSTFLDAAQLRGRRFGDREEVQPERLADEL
jgi:hypothetical protein